MTKTNGTTAAAALRAGLSEFQGSKGDRIVREFLEQIDAYYASPSTGFYDNRIERRYLEQKLRHLAWKPYPNDGLVTFGASGTNLCDRQAVFKFGGTKPEKSDDIPFRGRQRRVGNAVVDYFQLDLVHMQKRLGKGAKFTMAEAWNEYENSDGSTYRVKEWRMEDAAQVRKVFEYDGVKFAITAKPDGIFDYEGGNLLFEYKTKASGLVAMNGKLDFKGAQDDHLRQVTAESLVFGINEGLLVYESTEKPAWFSDEDNKNVPKTRKTWRDGKPVSDIRPFYFEITEAQQEALLRDLAAQAKLIYAKEVPEMVVDMTSKCGFCPFSKHCKASLTDEERSSLVEAEQRYAKSREAGKYAHRNLINYLDGVSS